MCQIISFILDDLEEPAKVKFAKVFRKVQDGTNTANDFKKLSGTNGIYEFRVEDRGAWYRMLAFIVRFEGDNHPTIIATHGFKKKKNKTPLAEIEKAIKIKKDY